MFADSSLSVVFENGTVEFANKTPAFANSWEVGTVCRPVDESANSWRSQTRANIYSGVESRVLDSSEKR